MRREVTKFEAVVEEDLGEETPKTLREYADLVDKVAKIGIEGWTRVTVKIVGRREELRDLAEELQTWKPSGGWSPDALKLFRALEGEETY